MSEYSYREKECACCGKTFIIQSVDDYVYKRFCAHGQKFFCSWTCFRKTEKGTESKADRREKIIQAIRDGLTNREIYALLGEDSAKVDYWRKKIREGKVDYA